MWGSESFETEHQAAGSGHRGHLDIGNSGIKFRRHSGGYSITGPQHDARYFDHRSDRTSCSTALPLLCHTNITTLQLIRAVKKKSQN